MFPDIEVTAYRKAVALFVNPVETLAALLVRNDVVGEGCCNFRWDFHRDRNEEGVAVVSDLTSSEWFRLSQLDLRQRHGPDVKILSVILSTDKTDLTKAGTRTLFTNKHTFFSYQVRFFTINILLLNVDTVFANRHTVFYT